MVDTGIKTEQELNAHRTEQEYVTLQGMTYIFYYNITARSYEFWIKNEYE